MRSLQRKIIKLCLAIFQHYEMKHSVAAFLCRRSYKNEYIYSTIFIAILIEERSKPILIQHLDIVSVSILTISFSLSKPFL